MFILHSSHGMLVLLLYVDDIILTEDNKSLLNSFVACLGKEFAMTDLDDLCFFLGIEAKCDVRGVLLTQNKYSLDILK